MNGFNLSNLKDLTMINKKRLEELEKENEDLKRSLKCIGEWFDDYKKGNYKEDYEWLIGGTCRPYMKES